MNYTLFLDESGTNYIQNINKEYPYCTLCGIFCNDYDYSQIDEKMKLLKRYFWKTDNIILRSYEIRRHLGAFKIFNNDKIKNEFYSKMNDIVFQENYKIICVVIDKEKYNLTKFRNIDPYHISLKFLLERNVFILDDEIEIDRNLNFIIEKRNNKENESVRAHLLTLLNEGTGFVTSSRIKSYNFFYEFRHKKDNINGLQLADLIAYPITISILEPKRFNPVYDLIKNKFYAKNGNPIGWGLKVFPDF